MIKRKNHTHTHTQNWFYFLYLFGYFRFFLRLKSGKNFYKVHLKVLETFEMMMMTERWDNNNDEIKNRRELETEPLLGWFECWREISVDSKSVNQWLSISRVLAFTKQKAMQRVRERRIKFPSSTWTRREREWALLPSCALHVPLFYLSFRFW